MDDDRTADVEEGWAEVRVLGPLRAWAADGTLVRAGEWGSSKNADLLRWIALEGGRPVPDEVLVEALWPQVDEAHGRSSLRTAVLRLRRLVGSEVVRRGPGGVSLERAWVDATSFRALADRVGADRRAGRPEEALRTAREALSLYLDDVAAVGAPTAVAEHAEALAGQRRRCLEDAAEAAAAGGWFADAVELGRAARDVAPLSERASRALMLGWTGLGESDLALREYARCRRVLDEELGALPSPQTRAVHRQVLAPVPLPPRRLPLIGLRDEVAWLRHLLAPLDGSRSEPLRVLVAGPPGSGRRAVVRAACAEAGRPLVEVGSPVELAHAAVDQPQAVLLWEPGSWSDRPLLEELLTRPPSGHFFTVVVVAPTAGTEPVWEGLSWGIEVPSLELGRLLEDDLSALAASLLAAPVSPALVEELVRTTDCVRGRVVEATRELAGSGRLVMTQSGLAAVRPAPGADDGSGRRLAVDALAHLEGDPLEALLLTAVLDRPVRPALLASVMPGSRGAHVDEGRAAVAIDHLVEMSLLRPVTAGAAFPHPAARDAVYSWLRPTRRRRLHRLVAARAPMAGGRRVQHWLEAQETRLAASAALDAAQEHSSRGDPAGARTHLLTVVAVSPSAEEVGPDGAEVFELLGDTCVALRRLEEAHDAYGQGLSVARHHLLPSADRLARKLVGAADPLARGVAGATEAQPLTRLTGLDGLGVRTPLELADILDDAVLRAEGQGEPRTTARLRMLRAGAVHLPRRQFRQLHDDVSAALASSPPPVERLEGLLLRAATQVLLGRARHVREELEEIHRASARAGHPAVAARAQALRALAAHDLDEAGADGLVDELERLVVARPGAAVETDSAVLALRVLVERDELERAAAMTMYLSPTTPSGWGLLLQHLGRLAQADLAEATGEEHEAEERLQSLMDDGITSGSLLTVPEAGARLVRLLARSDPDRAHLVFDRVEEVTTSSWGSPRDEFWRRMARASLRAARGQVVAAAGAYAQAARVAGAENLHVLAARARHERSRLGARPDGGSRHG